MRLRILEKIQTEHGGHIRSLGLWRKRVEPIFDEMRDDRLFAMRAAHGRRLARFEAREFVTLIIAVVAIVLDHVLGR